MIVYVFQSDICDKVETRVFSSLEKSLQVADELLENTPQIERKWEQWIHKGCWIFTRKNRGTETGWDEIKITEYEIEGN